MGVLAVGMGVSWVCRRRLLRRQLSTEARRLAALWVGAVETMLDVPKAGTIVLQPAASDEESRESFLPEGIPEALRTGRAFALTAFDPPGVSRSRDDNAKANDDLWQVLRSLEPAMVWPGFGVDVDERWREDGFILQWPAINADDARNRILAVASDFQQGAIYEYYATDGGALRRRTLGAKLAQIDEETPMKRVAAYDLLRDDPLFKLKWAGPDLHK